jgi:hypothetical protein
LELKVDEVSLVDLPANESDFVVVKSQAAQEEEIMSGKNATAETENNTERVPVEVPDSSDPNVAKALEHVSNIVESITKSLQTPAAKPAETVEETDKAKNKKGGGYSMRDMVKTLLPKASEDEISKHLETLKKSGLDVEAVLAATTKAVETAPAAPAPAAPTREEVLSDFIDAVSKAKSFTPERIDALKQMMETLKLMLQEVAPGASPNTSTPPLKVSPSSGIQDLMANKSLEPLVKALEGLKEAVEKSNAKVEGLEKEVTAIKSAKPAPASEQDDSAAPKPVKKGFWGGVL